MPYLPAQYRRFQKRYPKLAKAYERFAVQVHEAGPLSERERRLVKLGMAIGASSQGAVKSHARRALEVGVTAEEARHAVVLALTTVGFPTMIAASEWLEDVLAAHK